MELRKRVELSFSPEVLSKLELVQKKVGKSLEELVEESVLFFLETCEEIMADPEEEVDPSSSGRQSRGSVTEVFDLLQADLAGRVEEPEPAESPPSASSSRSRAKGPVTEVFDALKEEMDAGKTESQEDGEKEES